MVLTTRTCDPQVRERVPMRFKIVILASALAISASGATVAQTIDRPVIEPSPNERSIYGVYLAGREAARTGEGRTGAALLAVAADAAPDDGEIRQQAFAAAIFDGDVSEAARLAPEGGALPATTVDLGRVTRAVAAIDRGQGALALKALETPVTPIHQPAALSLKPFALAQAGRWSEALTPQDTGGDRLKSFLDRMDRAALLEAHGRRDDAEALYRELIAEPAGATFVEIPYAEFLERGGKWDGAAAMLGEVIRSGGGDPAITVAYQKAQARGVAPLAPRLSQSPGRSLYVVAAVLSAQKQSELALIYARLALALDPTLDRAWIVAGDCLASSGAEAVARASFEKVTERSPYYAEARTRIAYSYQRSGDLKAAVGTMRALLQARPGVLPILYVYADLLRSSGDFGQASIVLDQVVAGGGSRDWRVLYMRALTRDRLGRWSEAEADLRQALSLSPNQPEVLNYLGFSLVDRREDVKGGTSLIERAVAAQPKSGAMQDSLAWAYYRAGDYPKAVELLEGAVGLDAADPAINDHLGDAYWMVGKKAEARYQWIRVLSLAPEERLRTLAEAKIKNGLLGQNQASAR